MINFIGKIFTNHQIGKIRVIGADEIEVFYEAWGLEDWYYANTRSAIFGRLSTKYFLENFQPQNEQPENPIKYVERFYPLLPLRVLRFNRTFWSVTPFNSINELQEYCSRQDIVIDDRILINTNEIYLSPISSLGRVQKGPLIRSNREGGFTAEELLYQAFAIQSKYVSSNQSTIQFERYGPKYSGIGIYREGIRSNKPSYYIGAYHDLAGSTLKAETEIN